MGFFDKLTEGLTKTRESIFGGVTQVFKSFQKVDEELFEELEETLIMADIGVETSTGIIGLLRKRAKEKRIVDVEGVKNLLVEIITEMLYANEAEEDETFPAIILVVGINGVGKTTTIGKLANIYKKNGKKVILAAADTFRAAAIDQLEVWGKRSQCDVIKQKEGSDPGAVVFDAIAAAKSRKADVLICDTAGRLHNKKNLMDELNKINKIITAQFPEAKKEVFIVLDATAGQNSLQQVKIFKEICNVTGIVLTKLDGTAKGGIIIGIKNELDVPVRFVGVGEGVDDLEKFSAEEFAKAVFGQEEGK